MRLTSLIGWNKDLTIIGPDVDVRGIAIDSRLVEKGDLFMAIVGTKHDGRHYVSDALERGASALIVTEPVDCPSHVAMIVTPHVREVVAHIASLYYPRQPKTMVAVTGTSGKTSTAQFTRQMWQGMGYPSASIGTLGLVTAHEHIYGSLTTPEAITLHRMLDDLVERGITHGVMEASSHGLMMHRLDCVRLQAAGWTNLSRDHLDYHETMEAYAAAKMRLFREVLQPGGVAVLNADDAAFPLFHEAATAQGVSVMAYGRNAKDIQLNSVLPDGQGQQIHLTIQGSERKVYLPVLGAFQVHNALCALGMIMGAGGDRDAALNALAQVMGVPGRLEYVGKSPQGGTVFVDYAHKPDALASVLTAMQPHVAPYKGAKLGVVFGCGGNRDRGKRPLMGDIAARMADWVVVTDDNPRDEVPDHIRAEIVAGIPVGADVCEVADRKTAIGMAIDRLGPHDVLVIAGKGHEGGQIVAGITHPFDDRDVARSFLA